MSLFGYQVAGFGSSIPPLENYFGSGADGATTISSDTEISVTEDTGVAIKHYSSLTIDASQSLTTNNRCKAFLVYVTGNCTINGTLKMDSRGAAQAAGGEHEAVLAAAEQAGVQSIAVVPFAAATRAISSVSSRLLAPSSTPGRTWVCMSYIAYRRALPGPGQRPMGAIA